MQELEKILEEIEELRGQVGSECTSEDHYMKKSWEYCLDLVGKIIRKHMNDGWIPVEERLPEADGFYMATMDGEIVGQEESFVGLAEFENSLWVDDDMDYKCIIAWRPLPEPYRPERRAQNGNQ